VFSITLPALAKPLTDYNNAMRIVVRWKRKSKGEIAHGEDWV